MLLDTLPAPFECITEARFYRGRRENRTNGTALTARHTRHGIRGVDV